MRPFQVCHPLRHWGPEGLMPEGREQGGGTRELGSESRLKV